VLAINGVPTATILSGLLEYARTDGANEAKRLANLGIHPAERWEAFDVYFPLVFPQPSGQWAFKVRAPGGSSRIVRAIPATVAQRMAVYDSVRRTARDTTSPPWTFRVDDDGVATLAMPTWVTFNDHWDWEGFIHRAFAELAARRATALIVDLRGNEGGTSVGDVILAHLTDHDVPQTQLRRYTRYRAIPADLKPYLDTWDRSFDDWGAAATPASTPPGGGTDGFFRLTSHGDASADGVIRPVAPRFGGKVFVLVGADNSSATFEFALAVREQGLGTLVGQPTGGNQRGINGGAFYFLRLPNSGVEVDLPLIGLFPPGTRPDAGLTPDVVVHVTPKDVAQGRDPEAAAVRALLTRGSDDRSRGGGQR
jgi:C-terminal processing protease CtpA/Prc